MLLNDPAVRNQMQLRALETVEHFTWDKCIAELERALQLVASAQGDDAGRPTPTMIATSGMNA
jgi:hypothetical protein